MTERQIADGICAYLRKEGLLFIRARMDKKSTIAEGWPDITVVHVGKAWLCEVKTPTGKLSVKQGEVIGKLRTNGNRVCVATSVEMAVNDLKHWAGVLAHFDNKNAPPARACVLNEPCHGTRYPYCGGRGCPACLPETTAITHGLKETPSGNIVSTQKGSQADPVTTESYACPFCAGVLTHCELHYCERCWHCYRLLPDTPWNLSGGVEAGGGRNPTTDHKSVSQGHAGSDAMYGLSKTQDKSRTRGRRAEVPPFRESSDSPAQSLSEQEKANSVRDFCAEIDASGASSNELFISNFMGIPTVFQRDKDGYHKLLRTATQYDLLHLKG